MRRVRSCEAEEIVRQAVSSCCPGAWMRRESAGFRGSSLRRAGHALSGVPAGECVITAKGARGGPVRGACLRQRGNTG